MNSRINTIIIVILLSAIMLMLFISVGMLNKIQVASSTNNEIVLKAGEEIILEKYENLRIKFVSAKLENGCPEGAQCIRAGDWVFIIALNGAKLKMDFISNKNIELEKYTIELLSHNKDDSITLKIKRKV
jgi:hypothetical protein